MTRRPIYAANWKMNKLTRDAEVYCHDLINLPRISDRAELVVFPPFTSLGPVAGILQGKGVEWGAQNVYVKDSGAFTGEISPGMLKDLGCTWILVGHSERRHVLGEKDELIAEKVQAVIRAGLLPNLCVGETLDERNRGGAREVVLGQIRSALPRVEPDQVGRMCLSYEPVWAIGTGVNATGAQAQEMCGLIREEVSRNHGKTAGDSVRILYGGSVKPENIREFSSQPDVDGALIGGASLEARSFHSIILRGLGEG